MLLLSLRTVKATLMISIGLKMMAINAIMFQQRHDIPHLKYYKYPVSRNISFSACSILCASDYPKCRAFSLENGLCHHGFIRFRSETDPPLQSVFIELNDIRILDFWNRKMSDESFSDHFLYKYLLLGDKLHLITSRQMVTRLEPICMGNQGTFLPNLQNQDTFNAIVESFSKFKEIFVGLETSYEGNCSNSECNSHLTWNDGTPFHFMDHFNCISSSGPAKFMLTLASEVDPSCNTDASPPFWQLAKTNDVVRAICQFNVDD